MSERRGGIVIGDRGRGFETGYMFQFKVGEIANPHSLPVALESIPAERDSSRLRHVRERIRDPRIRLNPTRAGG